MHTAARTLRSARPSRQHRHRLALLALLLAGTVLLLAGCASNGATEEKASASAAADKEARCMVTGSNLPKRDCRNDVVVLPPAAAETVMPVLPSSVPRN